MRFIFLDLDDTILDFHRAERQALSQTLRHFHVCLLYTSFIIYPDGRHYLAINTFEWLEDEKLFIYVDQGPEEQAFETFFKTCYATK